MEWLKPAIEFVTTLKSSGGWVQFGIGMFIALVMFAVYRKERIAWTTEKTQLFDACEEAVRKGKELEAVLQRRTEADLASSQEREKRASEHAALHESERNMLMQLVQSFTESLTALTTLLETYILRQAKRRK
jgi:hypothetical protein